jgi:hypothetical protein
MWGGGDVPGVHALRSLVEGAGAPELAAAFNKCVMAVYLFR